MSSAKVVTKLILTDPQGMDNAMDPVTKSITSMTEQQIQDFSIATATTQSVWDPLADATEVMSAFTFLYIRSDQTVHVEFIVDDGAEVGKVIFTVPVVADLPFMLGADDSYANPGADDATSGTLDLFERIRINNVSGSTANVRVVMAN